MNATKMTQLEDRDQLPDSEDADTSIENNESKNKKVAIELLPSSAVETEVMNRKNDSINNHPPPPLNTYKNARNLSAAGNKTTMLSNDAATPTGMPNISTATLHTPATESEFNIPAHKQIIEYEDDLGEQSDSSLHSRTTSTSIPTTADVANVETGSFVAPSSFPHKLRTKYNQMIQLQSLKLPQNDNLSASITTTLTDVDQENIASSSNAYTQFSIGYKEIQGRVPKNSSLTSSTSKHRRTHSSSSYLSIRSQLTPAVNSLQPRNRIYDWIRWLSVNFKGYRAPFSNTKIRCKKKRENQNGKKFCNFNVFKHYKNVFSTQSISIEQEKDCASN